jgi:hypothetical protein
MKAGYARVSTKDHFAMRFLHSLFRPCVEESTLRRRGDHRPSLGASRPPVAFTSVAFERLIRRAPVEIAAPPESAG